MTPVKQLFADDFMPGFRFQGDPTTLTESHFLGFAAFTGDRHPIHYDAEYAARTKFGRPVAHGLLLTAMTALGATALSDAIEESMIALVRQQMQFLRPAFVGDVVMSQFEVTANEPTSNGQAARITIAVRLINQNRETVLEGQHVYLLRRRARRT